MSGREVDINYFIQPALFLHCLSCKHVLLIRMQRQPSLTKPTSTRNECKEALDNKSVPVLKSDTPAIIIVAIAIAFHFI